MEAKEKAKELVSSFMSIKNTKLSDYSVIYLPAAKKCALIAVDEIVKSHTYGLSTELKTYWEDVKQEIENL